MAKFQNSIYASPNGRRKSYPQHSAARGGCPLRPHSRRHCMYVEVLNARRSQYHSFVLWPQYDSLIYDLRAWRTPTYIACLWSWTTYIAHITFENKLNISQYHAVISWYIVHKLACYVNKLHIIFIAVLHIALVSRRWSDKNLDILTDYAWNELNSIEGVSSLGNVHRQLCASWC